MIDYAARWLLEHLPVRHDVTLVHNDFRNGNLMVDSTGIVGVLDWEFAHVGIPCTTWVGCVPTHGDSGGRI
ncbi:MAG: hypothetical protein CM1200mP9_07530 [Gammaproteobacteria bacterium]|nr:MAG: hypothetical protein CM1200mP9_07530 [Gammaproteobacteria bacterium]